MWTKTHTYDIRLTYVCKRADTDTYTLSLAHGHPHRDSGASFDPMRESGGREGGGESERNADTNRHTQKHTDTNRL